MKKGMYLLAILLMLIAFHDQIKAVVLKELTFEQICNESNEIVRSQVKSMSCFYLDNKNDRIYTEVNLRILDSLKGQYKQNDNMTLFLRGGTIDGITTFIPGAPNFKINQEVLLFLKSIRTKSFNSHYVITGFSQGKFDVIDNNGQKIIKRSFPLTVNEKTENAINFNNSILLYKDFEIMTNSMIE